MALYSDSMVLRWGPDLDDPTAGNCVLTDLRSFTALAGAGSNDWLKGLELVPGKLSGTCRTPVRAVGAWAQWGRAQVCGLLLTGVKYRATNGTTTYYWTGSAWALATTDSHWSDASTAWAALPSWSHSSLGWVVKLTRAAIDDDSPQVLGIKAVCRILFAQTSGNEDRPASWDDDLIHRVFLDKVADVLTVAGSHEKVVDSSFAYLDYASGVEDWPYNVVGVDAVYNVTDDPNLRTPLAGTWSSSTKRWTPSTRPATGKRLHAQFRHAPECAYTGMADYFSNQLPLVLVESMNLIARHRPHGREVVYNPTTKDCVTMPWPADEAWSLSCRIVAARTTDAQRIGRAVEKWLMDGLCVVSPGTSLPARLTLETTPRPGSMTGDAAEVRFSVRADVETWNGQEMTGVTVQAVDAEFDSSGR